jgi:hypothetical protein
MIPGAALVGNQIAIGRIEPQQTELALAEIAILDIAMDAMIQQLFGVPGTLPVVFHTEGLHTLAAQVVFTFRQGDTFAGTGIENP